MIREDLRGTPQKKKKRKKENDDFYKLRKNARRKQISIRLSCHLSSDSGRSDTIVHDAHRRTEGLRRGDVGRDGGRARESGQEQSGQLRRDLWSQSKF